MKIRNIIFSLIIGTVLMFTAPYTRGQTCSSEEECNKLIKEYESKLGSIREQKNTLSSQIQFADTQIYLTALRIQDAEAKVKKTGEEIENISGKIDGLNESLSHVSKLLIEKIAEGYKRRDVPFLSVIVDSDKASILANRLKYAKTVEENDRRLAFQVQQAKLNFQQQKELREKKKEQLAQLTIVLEDQKKALDVQKGQKQKLLADTQNDEATYQRLLAQAQAQIRGFKSFVQGSGASSTIGANAFGSGSDGAYYSQRDERWAHNAMGASSENILDVGCLVSSIAMVSTKLGSSVTPAGIAADSGRFWLNTAWMRYPWPGVAGRTYRAVSDIDAELNSGNYVIVGVGGCSNGGSHFVVLTRKDGDSYIMHDPIYGPDIKFSDHYSNMCSKATFK